MKAILEVLAVIGLGLLLGGAFVYAPLLFAGGR